MNIDSIQNGFVIDHIRAGKGMELYRYLGLDELNCSVAIIKNVKSNRMGRKDIIKIDETIPLDLDLLGYVDPNASVNIIRDGWVIEKKRLTPPQRISGILRCKNPRCITSVEQEIEHVFLLSEQGGAPVYRCAYCETIGK